MPPPSSPAQGNYARDSLATRRQYMGEALITKGDMTGAREQLSEIEKRCGRACEDYAKLAAAITDSCTKGPSGS